MKPSAWPDTLDEARRLQERLRGLVKEDTQVPDIRRVAGVDVAYAKGSGWAFCAIVVLSLPELERLDQAQAIQEAHFPYVPGFLSFREGPLIEEAACGLNVQPDVWLFDGHGISHPCGVGLASHMGVVLAVRSIGCAKECLCGEYADPEDVRGAWQPMIYQGRIVGRALRTRAGVKPVFVSIGHQIDLETATTVCLRCGRGMRLPEPLRQAHTLSRQILRESSL